MVYFNNMLRRVVLALISVFLVLSFAAGASAEYAPGKLMIKFKPGVLSTPRGMKIAAANAASVKASSIAALNTKYGVKRVKQLYKAVLEARPQWKRLADNFVLYFPEDSDLEEIMKHYEQDPNVVWVERVTRVRAYDTTPNDTHFPSQYGLANIKCPQAWDRTTGDTAVTVAVLDTGVNASHEDLVGRLDMAHGWDFVNNDSNPADDYGHGTSVSGVIGATTNNSQGVAGVDWQCQIMPVKVLDNQGRGDMDDILDGIVWAVSNEADVINMSFGQYTPNTQLHNACQDAYNDGVVLVAAAGNGNTDQLTYPASYSFVLAAAAVDSADHRSVWSGIDPETFRQQASNYGTWVDICAPGTGIYSTHMNGGYSGTFNGTSYASPFVAGLAALIKAADAGLSNQQIMDKIKDTTDDIDGLNPGFEGLLGTGRINAYLALAGAVANISSPATGSYVTGAVTVYGAATGWDFSSYALEVFQGATLVATLAATSTSVESGGILGTWESSAYNGEYTIKLTVFSVGTNTEEAQVAVHVDNTPPTASITYPGDGQAVSGSITFQGTANDQYLDTYLLEYGAGDAPASFLTIKLSYVPVNAGVLGTWETSGLLGIYTVRLTAADKVGSTTTRNLKLNILSSVPTKEVDPQPGLPLTYALPNPFNRSASTETTLNYSLEGNFSTRIYLFDLAGNLIWQQSYAAGDNGGRSGMNSVAWDGRSLFGETVANGVYVYKVVADGRVLAKGKIIVLN